MAERRKTAVIIAAAGSGSRMGGGIPKQYRMCGGLPVLIKAVKAFYSEPGICCITVAAAAHEQERCRSLLARYGLEGVKVVAGGDSRSISVKNALDSLPEEAELVLVHDAARPFVSAEVIERVLRALEESPAAIPCVRPKSTIRTAAKTLDRSSLYEVQTPQGFERSLLAKALENAFASGFALTDEAAAAELLGQKVSIVEGSCENIKITTPEDLPSPVRSGNGYDVHRLVQGRPLMLGCTHIPYEKGLSGHSDADVLSHAIADALLGAAALGDIGRHFPDSDPACEGMSGASLLGRVAALLEREGFRIVNIDATLIAQQPKIAPYAELMRANTAKALGIPMDILNIKATTEEGLGFTGSGEAMAAMASANIY